MKRPNFRAEPRPEKNYYETMPEYRERLRRWERDEADRRRELAKPKLVKPPVEDRQFLKLPDLGEALTRLRNDRYRSLRALARDAGILHPQLARIEGGQQPTLATLGRLLTALDATLELGPGGRFLLRKNDAEG